MKVNRNVALTDETSLSCTLLSLWAAQTKTPPFKMAVEKRVGESTFPFVTLRLSHPGGASRVGRPGVEMVTDFLASRQPDVHIQTEVTRRRLVYQILWERLEHHHGGLRRRQSAQKGVWRTFNSDHYFHFEIQSWCGERSSGRILSPQEAVHHTLLDSCDFLYIVATSLFQRSIYSDSDSSAV